MGSHGSRAGHRLPLWRPAERSAALTTRSQDRGRRLPIRSAAFYLDVSACLTSAPKPNDVPNSSIAETCAAGLAAGAAVAERSSRRLPIICWVKDALVSPFQFVAENSSTYADRGRVKRLCELVKTARSSCRDGRPE
jgi:hypothetical protein